MKGGGGLAVLLGGPPEADDGEDLDDYSEDLAPMDDEGGNAAFDMYAETALGSNDPAKLSALREAIRAVLEESQAPVDIEAEMGPMGPMAEV